MELIPGVHLVDGSFPNNIYLITDGGPVLVDTGVPGNCPRVVRYMRNLGLRTLKAVVLTHSHFDHMGSAGRIADATGAEVWAHELDIPCIEGRRPGCGYGSLLELYRDVLSRPAKTHVHRTLREGDTIDCLGGLRVLHTRGHTRGSICMYQPERGILFTGDTVQYSRGRIGLPKAFSNCDTNELWASAARLSELEFEYMLPTDGHPLLEAASNRLREFLRAEVRSTRTKYEEPLRKYEVRRTKYEKPHTQS